MHRLIRLFKKLTLREIQTTLCLTPCVSLQVADITLAAKFTAFAISGPPVEEGLPVFSWNRFNRTKHQGLPDSYNFDFITMKPVL